MWTPHPPTYEGLTLGPLVSGRSAQYGGGQDTLVGPLCNMDFGGPGGSLLRSLTRLVFRMEYATPFVGLECHYRDQPIRVFGDTSPTACELSFLVNGTAGERINCVDLMVRRRVICGIRVLLSLRLQFGIYGIDTDECFARHSFQPITGAARPLPQ
jgi:hypothetical protein